MLDTRVFATVGALIGTACVTLSLASSAGASAFPGANGPIVFDQTTGTGVNAPTTTVIEVANPDGSDVGALTSPPTNQSDIDPRLSADGRWIVFERTGFAPPGGSGTVTHVMLMRADGSDLIDLTPGIGASATGPSFAPDGASVVFAEGGIGIFKVSVTLPSSGPPTAGKSFTQLTTGDDEFPTISPDGKQLAFTRVAPDFSSEAIYVCAISACANPTQVSGTDGGQHPDFSPDATEIAYDTGLGLYEAPTSGGTPVQLVASPSGKRYEHPSFSPDGTEIVFDENTFTVGPGGSPTHSLLAMAATPGATPTVITGLGGTPTVSNADPDWASGDQTSTTFSCSPEPVFVGSAAQCSATVTDTSSSPSIPTGSVNFSGSGGSIQPASCTLMPGATAGEAVCTQPVTVTPSSVSGMSITASYPGAPANGSSPGFGPSSHAGVENAIEQAAQLTVHIEFSCPSDAPPCGAPYPPNQPAQPGAGRVLGTPSNVGAGGNFDCWAPSPPPGFTESGDFAETCSLPVSAGQTFNLSAYAGTYGYGPCSNLFCPGTGWPPWRVTGFSSSSNVSGCSGTGGTCAATMGAGQNDITVTLVPADLRPELGGIAWALGSALCGPVETAGCLKLYSGEVWNFADGAADLDHDPHVTESWDWGDGTQGCPANVRWGYLCTGGAMAHQYVLPAGATDPKTFTITVTAIDSDGQAAQPKQATITVWPAPASSLSTFSSALGSSVETVSHKGGSVTTSTVLPSSASSVTATVTPSGGGATTASVKRSWLSKLVRRNVKPGALVMRLRPTNHKLLGQIKAKLHRAHKHRLPAKLTLLIKLANGKTVRIVQHIKLLL